jgi:hypothetical protein
MLVWTTAASKLMKMCQARAPPATNLVDIFGIPTNMLSKTFLPTNYNQTNECFHWWLGLCDSHFCQLHHSPAPMAGMDNPSFGKVSAILDNNKPPNVEGGAGR